MVDIVSIIIAVVSFVGALAAAGIAGWVTIFSDKRKRLSQAEALLEKYSDPLLIAAHDLQSRLYNLADQNVSSWIDLPGSKQINLIQYTSFLVGQFLSWTHIIRRESQFLRFATHKDNRRLTATLGAITDTLSTDKVEPAGFPFILWHSQQQALGEVMTVKEGDQHFSMGYSDFHDKWTGDAEFRKWFHGLEDSITQIARKKVDKDDVVPDFRLRRLQHLLIQLIRILDPEHLHWDTEHTSLCKRPPTCKCDTCTNDPPEQHTLPRQTDKEESPSPSLPLHRFESSDHS